MKIGIDLRNVWLSYQGGTTSYALGLVHGFLSVGAGYQFKLYCGEHNYPYFSKNIHHPNFEVRLAEVVKSLPFSKARQKLDRFILRARLKTLQLWVTRLSDRYSSSEPEFDLWPDVVYSPMPRSHFSSRAPTIVSIHDIQQVHFPQFFAKEDLNYRAVIYNLNAENSNFLQASSEFMKSDFLKYFKKLKDEQVVVIPEGVDIPSFINADPGLLKRHRLPEKFLYYPGQLWLHKDHLTVLKALKQLEDEQGVIIPIVLTGAKYSAADQIFSFVERNRMHYVTYLGVVSFDEVKALYKACYAMITATLYESSSLPIREAAAAGTAIIASSTPPNVEASQVLEINLFPTQNSRELAKIILNFWNAEGLRAKQIEENSKAIHVYSWNSIAEKYLDLFRLIGPSSHD